MVNKLQQLMVYLDELMAEYPTPNILSMWQNLLPIQDGPILNSMLSATGVAGTAITTASYAGVVEGYSATVVSLSGSRRGASTQGVKIWLSVDDYANMRLEIWIVTVTLGVDGICTTTYALERFVDCTADAPTLYSLRDIAIPAMTNTTTVTAVVRVKHSTLNTKKWGYTSLALYSDRHVSNY